MSKKFLIFAPPYHPDDGGGLVLHVLCSMLNELGREAYITRLFNGEPIYKNHWGIPMVRLIKHRFLEFLVPYRTHPKLYTPVFDGSLNNLDDDWIVIYPEIVFGNPLNAPNVVRWLLHKPGFHTGNVFFSSGDFIIGFSEFGDGFTYPGAHKSRSRLYVLRFPFDHYNLSGALTKDARKGTAYCIRKGKDRPVVHGLEDSILIDGKSHPEIAAIFKQVTTFISYDPYTAYSSFAVLCGARSVVVPEPGVKKEEWYADPAERYGVAYGFEDIVSADNTAHMVLGHMKRKEAKSLESVINFLAEVEDYFAARPSIF